MFDKNMLSYEGYATILVFCPRNLDATAIENYFKQVEDYLKNQYDQYCQRKEYLIAFFCFDPKAKNLASEITDGKSMKSALCKWFIQGNDNLDNFCRCWVDGNMAKVVNAAMGTTSRTLFPIGPNNKWVPQLVDLLYPGNESPEYVGELATTAEVMLKNGWGVAYTLIPLDKDHIPQNRPPAFPPSVPDKMELEWGPDTVQEIRKQLGGSDKLFGIQSVWGITAENPNSLTDHPDSAAARKNKEQKLV